MKYLVLECHPAYAVVLDSDGRFLKVANLRYQPGDTVTDVILWQDPAIVPLPAVQSAKETRLRTVGGASRKKQIVSVSSIAACFCVMMVLVWQFFLFPYGSVRIQINPDVELTVNRLDRVIDLTDRNEDGKALIDGYSYRWKTVDQVTEELADRSVELGYLKAGGTVRITTVSSHDDWKQNTAHRLIAELTTRFGTEFSVTDLEEQDDPSSKEKTDDSSSVPPKKKPSAKASASAQQEKDDDDEDDDDNDKDDDRDDVDDDGDDEDDNDDDDDDDDQPVKQSTASKASAKTAASQKSYDDEDDDDEDDDDDDDQPVKQTSPAPKASAKSAAPQKSYEDDEDDDDDDNEDEDDD